MKRLLVAIALVLLAVHAAAASIVKIDLTKTNQATAPVKFTLTSTTASSLRILRIAIPRKQTPLDHLWRIDLVVRKGQGSAITAPLETKLENGELTSEIIVDPDSMKGLEIWIRTGEHAPLSETVYAIDIGSFK